MKLASSVAAFLLVCGLAAAPTPDIPHGKAIFENHCAECHLADSTDENVGPGLKGLKEGKLPDGKKATRDKLLDIINTGPAEMTSFKDILSEQEKEDVVAYVMTL